MHKIIPKCVGIIMDGNRRWAKMHGFATFEGHRHGYETMKSAVDWAKEIGIGTIIFFAFSEENWNRSKAEVAYLMSLVRTMLVVETKVAICQNFRKIYKKVLRMLKTKPEIILGSTW